MMSQYAKEILALINNNIVNKINILNKIILIFLRILV